jgi:hypothetical protein
MGCDTASLLHEMSQVETGDGNDEFFEDPIHHFTVVQQAPKQGVTRQQDPRVTCKYCNHSFSGGSYRQRAHLALKKGCGVTLCDKVPSNVKRFYQTLAATKKVLQTKIADEQALDDLTADMPAWLRVLHGLRLDLLSGQDLSPRSH